ncbi:hypothetical protein [Sphingomonas aerolata]|uniref:hypothetical protein n=1 Tax=Sphingomonas aerolata TaxID=185951 RepID=UPI002FE288AD
MMFDNPITRTVAETIDPLCAHLNRVPSRKALNPISTYWREIDSLVRRLPIWCR